MTKAVSVIPNQQQKCFFWNSFYTEFSMANLTLFEIC